MKGDRSLDNQNYPYGPPGFPHEPSFPGGGGQQFPGGGGHPFPGGSHHGGFPFPGGGHQFPGGGGHGGAPTTPPPSVIPQESVGLKAIDPGAIRRCLYRFTFVWLNNGRGFWFYPTYVGRTSTAGFRWRRDHWESYGTDLRRIRSFRCY